jgi:hypothetical protein
VNLVLFKEFEFLAGVIVKRPVRLGMGLHVGIFRAHLENFGIRNLIKHSLQGSVDQNVRVQEENLGIGLDLVVKNIELSHGRCFGRGRVRTRNNSKIGNRLYFLDEGFVTEDPNIRIVSVNGCGCQTKERYLLR